MEVLTRRRENVTILELSGDVTIGDGVEVLRNNVQKATDGNGATLLINLAGVNLMDSSGVGELVAVYTKLSKRGGSVKLLHLSPKVNNMLQIAHLLTIFEVFDDENEAIASFG